MPIEPARILYRREIITLDNGDLTLQWPSDLTEADITDMENWFGRLISRLKRKATVEAVREKGEGE